MKITRTERWKLRSTPQDRDVFLETISIYQRYVRALSSVCFTHWTTIGNLNGTEVIKVVESLIHPTKNRPVVSYAYFHRVFYKFPSHLRRSAIMDAVGQVRSFLNRYDQWQTFSQRKSKHQNPPKFGVSNTFPSLYQGQCIKYSDDFSFAEIKVFDRGDWVWCRIYFKNNKESKRLQEVMRNLYTLINNPDITKKEKEKLLSVKSPSLVIIGKKVMLSMPFYKTVEISQQKADTVCAIDLGINTAITASIVRSDGTVLARKFINEGSDMDRLHKRLSMIQKASKKTKKLKKGFCKTLYRRAFDISQNIAHLLTRQLVDFAKSHGATTLVFEHMKGWRPKSPRKSLRQRFHTWLHRRIVKFSQWKWYEMGGRLAFVSPKHTSKYAYDGSGKVARSPSVNDVKQPYDICRFKNGKIYNTDLNATYNIAAKYFLRNREVKQLGKAKDPCSKSRMPITLSLLWQQSSA